MRLKKMDERIVIVVINPNMAVTYLTSLTIGLDGNRAATLESGRSVTRGN